MLLVNGFEVAAPREAVWAALNDAGVVARCLPGATLTEYDDPTFTGTMSALPGPISLSYTGRGRYVRRAEHTGIVIAEINGRDVLGDSTAAARVTGRLGALGADRTAVVVEIELTLTGQAARLVQDLIADAADATFTTFAEVLNDELSSPRPAADPPTLPPAPVVDAPPAGWYMRDGDDEHRYWDGGRWTGQRRDASFTVFLSYARDDRSVARELRRDVERLGVPVWVDERLHGGQEWWQQILAEIRSCGAVVHAVSEDSLASEYCTRELEYARALGIAVLPVQIGDVAHLRTHGISSTQLIDYRTRDADAVVAVAVALAQARRHRGPLPDPLPPPAAMPYANLAAIRARLERMREPGLREQREILWDIESELDTAGSPSARADVADLLTIVRERSDFAVRISQEAGRLLAGLGGTVDR